MNSDKKTAACAKSDELTKQEIKEIEKSLLKMREEIQKRIKTKKETEMPEAEVGDDADMASQSLDKEVLFELNGNSQALLDQIEAALRRISKDIYGRCEYCRCFIPKKRIQALPFARYCIACQSSNEGAK
ncbi:MAG: TraR/DksA family transcriptional regulator [Elusimicrobiota bacterium]|jgi:DnaK suppressor protein|nr:TraR/DksA family transcriptional regulator [Elusimicrobiota bacterium]